MRTKVTLVLIFLNVALFVFIFKFERGWRTDQAQREARRRVLGPEAASIQHLRISGPGLATIELVRSGQQWSLTAPIDWPANPYAVNRILNELQFLEHETSFSVAELEKNKQSLADYGLEPPRLTIEFTPASAPSGGTTAPSPEPQRLTLQVGDETKVGNRLYLLSPQRDRVHVVGLSLARSLNLPLEELRTDNVFSIPLFEARSLTLQNAASSRVRIRQDGKHWSFEAPIIARASKPQVELAISALNSLRVHHFLPTGASNPATSTTNADLRIGLVGNNRQETLILFNEIESPPTASSENEEHAALFIAALEGKATRFVVEVPQPLLKTLRNAQDTLRDPRILDFEPEALTAVTLSSPNQAPLTLQQLRSSADGQHTWQIVRSNSDQGPQLQPVDPQRMRELIQTLRRLSAQRFVSDAPSDADLENWGFNRPEREITLTLNPPANSVSAVGGSPLIATEPQTLRLQIGRPSAPSPHLYARLSSARFVYEIPADLLAQTAPDPLQYRQLLLREIPETARFHSATLTDLSNGTTVLKTSVDDESSTSEAAPKVDSEARSATATRRQIEEAALPQTDRLFTALRRLEAASLIQDHFSETVIATGTERPWRWRLDITVRLPSGRGDEQSEIISLFLTERLGGDLQLAGSPQLGLVFAINQALLDALWPLTYRERSAEETTSDTPSESPSTSEESNIGEAVWPSTQDTPTSAPLD